MSRKFLFRAFCGLALSVAALAPASAAAPRATVDSSALIGHWACNGPHGPYSSDWAAIPGTTWIRGTDGTNGKVSAVHTVSYNNEAKTWTVIDTYTGGSYDVMQGTGSIRHVAAHTVYPAGMNVNLLFELSSPANFTVNVNGTQPDGHRFTIHEVCVKR